MKKTAVLFLCVIIILCGCGKNNLAMDQAISFRQKLLSAKQCTFECGITADYGDTLHSFSVYCEFDDSGNMSFQVLEPESIAGITGNIRSQGGELTFDDNALAFPLLADGYISPISAPWIFMKALRSGYIDSSGENESGYLILLNDSYEESPLYIELYTDQDCVPQRADMMWQGRRILSLDVKTFACL